MYNIYKNFYLIAVCKPEAAKTELLMMSSVPLEHVEPLMNVGIINSVTRLHFVGFLS
jgi:hypothetical protein